MTQQQKQTRPALEAEIKRLITSRKKWEASTATTNREHYNLLAEVATLAETYTREELIAIVNKAFRISTDTSNVLIAVKLVFGFETADYRKKASANAKAISNGLNADQTPATLAQWFVDVGGVEKARMGMTGPANTKRKAEKTAAVDAAKLFLKDHYASKLTVSAPNPAAVKIKVSGPEKAAIWYVHETANGDYDVIASFTSEVMLASFAAKFGAAIKADAKSDDIQLLAEQYKAKSSEQAEAILEASKK